MLIKYIVFVISIFLSFNLKALEGLEDKAPEDFKQLFRYSKKTILIEFYGSSIKIQANSNVTKVIIDDENEIDTLKTFFFEKGIDDSKSTLIITKLKEGVESSKRCTGVIRDCVLFTDSEEFVFDADSRVLKIFVNGEYFYKNKSRTYYGDIHSDLTFVNNLSGYAFLGSGPDELNSQLDILNKSNLTLPNGYISSDYKLSTTNSELYELNYILDQDGYSYTLGYGWANKVENISSNLLNNQRSKSVNATIGSSKKLQKTNSESVTSLVVFSAESAEVEIYREEFLVYRGMLNQGNNFIDYQLLPTGAYNVSILIKKAGVILKEEKQRVFNSNIYDSIIGEIDWFSSIGIYEDSEFSFIKIGLASRLLDELQLGLGYELVDLKSIYSIYSELTSVDNKKKVLLNLSIDDFGDIFYSAGIKWNNLYLNYDKLESDKKKYLNTIYGVEDYYTFTATYPIYFDDSYLSVNYSKTKNYTYSNEDINFSFDSSSYESIYVNYSKDFKWLDLSLSLEYSINDYFDDIALGINLNIPFGKNGNVSTNIFDSKRTSNNIRNTIRYANALNSEFSYLSELGISNEDVNAMLAAKSVNSRVNTDLLLNVRNDGNFGASLSMNSTQVVSSSGVDFTNSNANSFIRIKNDNKINLSEIGSVEIYDKSRKNINIVSDFSATNSLFPVRDYTSYYINVDTSKGAYVNTGDQSVKVFTKPGSVVDIDTSFIETNRYFISYSSLEDNLVEKVYCSGSGCINIEDVNKGVFILTLLNTDDVVIYTDNATCLIPPVVADMSQPVRRNNIKNLGKSYCIDNETLSSLNNLISDNAELYFIGYSEMDKYAGVNDVLSLTINEKITAYFSTSKMISERYAGNPIKIYNKSFARN